MYILSKEADFIRELQSGHPPAFEILVIKYQQRIYNTCYSFLKNGTLAEDQTQEVFIAIFNSINNFEQQSSLATWIYRIAISSCLDALRAQQTKKRKSSGILSIFSIQDSIPAKDQLNPYEHLENKEYALIIATSLDKMPDKYKTVFVLKYMEAKSQKEIALIMDITEKAVEGILTRSKAILKEEISKYYPEMRERGKKRD